jgi:Na+/H+ antiporter NhaD/arsenite permease-like protein
MLTSLIVAFCIGYLLIIFEHQLHINKAASAILAGVVCWSIYAIGHEQLVPEKPFQEWLAHHPVEDGGLSAKLHFITEGQLLHTVAEIAGIVFFLLGAMTIVELVDAHEGFSIVTSKIRVRRKSSLLWIVGFVTFFLSSILDNLTTTIVMVSLLRKLIYDPKDRLLFVGLVVIAANAGGAWTVIGDVTTTMLWIKGKIDAQAVMVNLFLPSLVCLLVPVAIASFGLKGDLEPMVDNKESEHELSIETWHKVLFLILGVGGLISVPIFKAITHLPPFVGMMGALGVLWIVSELVGHTMDERTRSSTGVLAVLKRVDTSSLLFFLGILLAVGSLGSSGVLQSLAEWLQGLVGNQQIIAFIIGLVSAVVDNVPLVAAGIDMYRESSPPNDPFWMLLAYCAGTGGSCLIIGSAAGVAAMGLEKIDFVWYAKKIAPLAFAGYLAGALVYVVQRMLFN